MKLLLPLVLAILLFGSEASAAPASKRGADTATKTATDSGKRATIFVNGVPDTGQFLPDDTVLARVEDRAIRAYDFRNMYFASDGQFRPKPDSLGRIEFLDNMIDKELLSLTALAANHPLSFEERRQLDAHADQVLDNVLYQRMVTDSVGITESEIEPYVPQFGLEMHLRSILFVDRPTGERVRRELLAGRIAWTDAARRYDRNWNPQNPDGDLGWVKRTAYTGQVALEAFSLRPGAISTVLYDAEGYRIVQCLEQRRRTSPGRQFAHAILIRDLRQAKTQPLVHRFYDKVRAGSGVVYDSTNIRWAAEQFKHAFDTSRKLPAGTIDLTGIMPQFSPEDTSRVLARTKTRQITLGQFIYEYQTIPALFRGQIISLEPFIFAFDGPSLHIERIALARSLGLEKDSLAAAQIGKRKEELLVEHLYQDSVTNKVNVTPEMRRKYYQDHEREFVSLARVHYARFIRPTAEEAEILMARLKGGEKAEDLVLAAQKLGDDTTSVLAENSERDADDYRKLLFEEMRPGEVTQVGPDRFGQFLVFQLLKFEAPRQMKFEEVQALVDESVQNTEGERLLKELLARLRGRFEVESHPELVPLIRLTDPTLELPTAARR